ncbi:SDR family oxidoreductase [Herbiconiux sp. VKM Ac-1786]|uniref:SDR family oxidoreductase n=1 Tax=Herbiconiux sp. VKM Ac-1786 TaxID=2783824 RepID=UPI00188BCD5E|nr:SDR family oxidoreductase [Herbiconiux sp. VKM Ac-1786]MBF4573194.1 SDR family oxidoreductase [Herbiconiux sp. VKM Ac-1786]
MKIAVAGGTGTVGRHIVDAARGRGHDAVVLARSTGVDLTTGAGLAPALVGVDVVVDAASVGTQSATVSRAFFGGVTTNLLAASQTAGVRHHLALSIVGSDRAPFGYYAGKALQEQAVTAGPVPWTILRATQFHEFAQQIYGQVTLGPITLVPRMLSQPVAAREVAARLVDLAEAGPSGHATDLAGPEELRMADMVRAYASATGGRGRIAEVPLPGGFGRALRDGTILAGPAADRGTQTFAEWIAQLPRVTDS